MARTDICDISLVHSCCLCFRHSVGVLTHLLCWPKKTRKRRTASTYCQPYNPLSVSRSRLRGSRAQASPRWSSLNTSHRLDSKSYRDFPLLRQSCSHFFYSTADWKTIYEWTLNVTPVPPGRKGDLKYWWSISTRSNSYRSVDPWGYCNIPRGSRWTKGEWDNSLSGVLRVCYLLLLLKMN